MSKRSRHSRLFSGKPGLLLVEEYPSISLPDNTDLPVRKDQDEKVFSQPIEVSEEDDDTDEDESGATARIFISSPRVPAGRPVGRSVSAVRTPARPEAVAPRLGRPRQLGTPRVVAGFSHPEDLPSPAYVAPSTPIHPLDEESDEDWGVSQALEDDGSAAWDSRLDRQQLEFTDEDSDEDFSQRPEPLRLALPQAAGEEASLVLAAGAVEDFDDDWDDEDDWSEEFSEDEDEDSASIRLSLGSNSSLDFLRDLEERRSFKAPIWGPRPDSTGFDDDVSLYEESDEDVIPFGDYEDVDYEDDPDDLVVDDEIGPSGPASVRVGVPLGQRGPRQLRPLDGAAIPASASDDSAEFDTPQFPVRDPLRAPRLGWTEDPSTDEEDTPRAWSDLTGLGEDPVRAFVPGRPVDEAPSQVRVESSSRSDTQSPLASREPVQARRVASSTAQDLPPTGIPPMVSAVAALLLGMSAMALIWVQFHEPLGLPFPGPIDPVTVESPAPAVVETPEGDAPETPSTELIEQTSPADSVPSEVASPELLTGKVMVLSDRRAAVFLDGRKIGITPMDEPLELDAGTYEVTAVALKTGKRQVIQARVDAGRSLEVTFEFR